MLCGMRSAEEGLRGLTKSERRLEDLVEASAKEHREFFTTPLGAGYTVGELQGAGTAAEKLVAAGGAVGEVLEEKLGASERA